MTRKVVDCFPFFNEFDILELRLTELYDIVDFFILVEANWTFSGIPKSFYFEENKDMYSKFLDKIIHVKVEDQKIPNCFKSNDKNWQREHYQRYCIQRGLDKLDLKNEDILIITDCDEIMDPEIVDKYKKCGLNGHFAIPLHLYFYNFNYKMIKKNFTKLPSIINYKTYVKKCNKNAHTVRGKKDIPYLDCDFKGGWHLTYFGNLEFIINKIKSYAHQEFNNDFYLNRETVIKKLKEGKYLFEDGPKGQGKHDLTYIKIEDNNYLPKNFQIVNNYLKI